MRNDEKTDSGLFRYSFLVSFRRSSRIIKKSFKIFNRCFCSLPVRCPCQKLFTVQVHFLSFFPVLFCTIFFCPGQNCFCPGQFVLLPWSNCPFYPGQFLSDRTSFEDIKIRMQRPQNNVLCPVLFLYDFFCPGQNCFCPGQFVLFALANFVLFALVNFVLSDILRGQILNVILPGSIEHY